MRQSSPTVENRAATNCFKYRWQRRLDVVAIVVVVGSDFDFDVSASSDGAADFRFRSGNFRSSQDRRLLSAAAVDDVDKVGDRKMATRPPSTTTKRFSDPDSVATSPTGSANASRRIRFSRPYVRRRRRRLFRSLALWSPSLVSLSGFPIRATASTSGDRPLPFSVEFSTSGFFRQPPSTNTARGISGDRPRPFAISSSVSGFSWRWTKATSSTVNDRLLRVAIFADSSIPLLGTYDSHSPSFRVVALYARRFSCRRVRSEVIK